MKTTVQTALIAMRQRLGLTQRDLSIAMDRSQPTVGRWESYRPPTGKSLVDLIRFAYRVNDESGVIFHRELFGGEVPAPEVKRWAA